MPIPKEKRDYAEEYKRRKNIQIYIGVPSRIFNIIKRNANPNVSAFICRAIEFYDRKHKDPKEWLVQIQQQKKKLAQKLFTLKEKEEKIQEFIKKQKRDVKT